MSEQSYQENLRRGVTGPNTDTCAPASFDRISSSTGVRPQNYERYHRAYRRYTTTDNWPMAAPEAVLNEFIMAQAAFARDLGVETMKNVVQLRINTEAELRRTLSRLAQGGFRTKVSLDIDGGLHGVGVIQLDDEYYDVRSTWSPFKDGEPVSVGELYEHLDQYPRIGKNARRRAAKAAKEPNIAALPPEPRRTR